MQKAILFGTGEGSHFVSDFLDYEILCFVDNNKAKWDSTHLGKPVVSPHELRNRKSEDVVIVIANRFYSEIKDQLLSMGYVEHKDFVDGFSAASRLLANIRLDMDNRVLLAVNKGNLSRNMRHLDLTLPSTWEYSAFSQNGEDGIVEVLLHHLKESNRYLIEIGSADGIENNTALLAIAMKYSGLLIEGNSQASKLSSLLYARLNLGITCRPKFISLDNVNEIKEESLYLNPDVMSVDLDGIDYYIVEALLHSGFRPKIFIVEYNSAFGPEESITICYDPHFTIRQAHETQLYYGASISAWKRLFGAYGYRFITVEQNGVNAFFVHPDAFHLHFLNDINGTHFCENFYQLSKFKFGWREQYQLISDMEYKTI